jgi:transketolase C-terminal domain/subunit
VQDSFGESGKGEELLKKYGLTSTKIKEACHSAVKRKLREF